MHMLATANVYISTCVTFAWEAPAHARSIYQLQLLFIRAAMPTYPSWPDQSGPCYACAAPVQILASQICLPSDGCMTVSFCGSFQRRFSSNLLVPWNLIMCKPLEGSKAQGSLITRCAAAATLNIAACSRSCIPAHQQQDLVGSVGLKFTASPAETLLLKLPTAASQ